MLKFILLLIVAFLVIRLVVRMLQGVFFSSGKEDSRRSGIPPSSFSSGQLIEEADYEVIESHLIDKERGER